MMELDNTLAALHSNFVRDVTRLLGFTDMVSVIHDLLKYSDQFPKRRMGLSEHEMTWITVSILLNFEISYLPFLSGTAVADVTREMGIVYDKCNHRHQQ